MGEGGVERLCTLLSGSCRAVSASANWCPDLALYLQPLCRRLRAPAELWSRSGVTNGVTAQGLPGGAKARMRDLRTPSSQFFPSQPRHI